MRENKNPMTRAEFLRGGLKSLLGLAADVLDTQIESKTEKLTIPLHRPPGAIKEFSFLTKCTRCDLCIEACPYNAIVHADARTGAAIGTPVIRPEETPCYLCTDMPCISACPEGALIRTDSIKMGTVYISKTRCFSYNGQVDQCDYCYDRCPLKGEAITLENNKPQVVAGSCVGCGICEYYCPAPGKAIKVLPERTNAEQL